MRNWQKKLCAWLGHKTGFPCRDGFHCSYGCGHVSFDMETFKDWYMTPLMPRGYQLKVKLINWVLHI
jgi:hypothetical protein